jgi:hypothetical protein
LNAGSDEYSRRVGAGVVIAISVAPPPNASPFASLMLSTNRAGGSGNCDCSDGVATW